MNSNFFVYVVVFRTITKLAGNLCFYFKLLLQYQNYQNEDWSNTFSLVSLKGEEWPNFIIYLIIKNPGKDLKLQQTFQNFPHSVYGPFYTYTQGTCLILHSHLPKKAPQLDVLFLRPANAAAAHHQYDRIFFRPTTTQASDRASGLGSGVYCVCLSHTNIPV